MEQPPGLSKEAALQRANCLAAAVLLNEGTFDETGAQTAERRRIVHEIAATDAETATLAAKARTWADRRVMNDLWAKLWPKVQRELVIRKVKV